MQFISYTMMLNGARLVINSPSPQDREGLHVHVLTSPD